MLKTKQYPIVGMHFRPPAETLVRVAPVGTKLYLVAEPFNEFDKNAIAVYMDLVEPLKRQPVVDALAASGNTDWVNRSSIQIGYIPKATAAYLKSHGFDYTELEATFVFPFGSNAPHAKFEFDETT